MPKKEPAFKLPIAENPEQQLDTEIPAIKLESKELSPVEIGQLSGVAIEAIRGARSATEVTEENFKQEIERSILNGVRGLPEALAKKLETVDASLLNQKAKELLSQITEEQDLQRLAKLQIELIYQYIGVISRVQNGGDRGFIPSVAIEVEGLDCSLSVWALKEKLQSAGVQNISFEFGYPPGHAVGVIKVADGRQLYVDAQNGFVEEVQLEQVYDPNNPDTAYPIFEVKASKRSAGSNYIPKYLGVREDGLLHSLGNMHMLANPTSPTFYTESARRFREGIGMPELEPTLYEAGKKAMERWRTDNAQDNELQKYFGEEMGMDLNKVIAYTEKWKSYYAKFEGLVEKVAGGKTIHDTKFGELEERHHANYQVAQRKASDQRKIKDTRKGLGI